MGILSFSGSSHAKELCGFVEDTKKENRDLDMDKPGWSERVKTCSSKDTLSLKTCSVRRGVEKSLFGARASLSAAGLGYPYGGYPGAYLMSEHPDRKKKKKQLANGVFIRGDGSDYSQSDHDRLKELDKVRKEAHIELKAAHNQFISDEKIGNGPVQIQLLKALHKTSLAHSLKNSFTDESDEIAVNKMSLDFFNSQCYFGSSGEAEPLIEIKERFKAHHKAKSIYLRSLEESLMRAERSKNKRISYISGLKKDISNIKHQVKEERSLHDLGVKFCKGTKIKAKKLEKLMISLIEEKKNSADLLKSGSPLFIPFREKYTKFIEDKLNVSNKAEEAYAKEIYLQRQGEIFALLLENKPLGASHFKLSKSMKKIQNGNLFKKCEVLDRAALNASKYYLASEYRAKDKLYKAGLAHCAERVAPTCSSKTKGHTFEDKKQAFVKLRSVCDELAIDGSASRTQCLYDLPTCTVNVNGPSSSSGKKGSRKNSKGKR